MAFGGVAPDDDGARERIRTELETIFQAPEFERAPVMRRLLDFLVAETLAGRGDALKAYSVAVDGLGRDADFDSQSDSYPRVQVGRLRKMLDAYYARVPSASGARLDIKPGGYRVDFEAPSSTGEAGGARAAEVPSRRLLNSSPPLDSDHFPWRLVVAAFALLATLGGLIWIVLRANDTSAPFRSAAQAPVLEIGQISHSGPGNAQMVARATRVLLENALHRSWLIRVRQDVDAMSGDLPETEAPAYRLTGNVDTTGLLDGPRITLTLRNLGSGDQLWSQTMAVPAEGASLPATLTPAIATLIGPFGVIATHQRSLVHPEDRPGYACLLDYDTYFRYRDPNLRARVRTCVAETVADEPMSAPALAAASFLSLDPYLGGRRPGASDRALDYARRAVAADPNSADAQAADARVAFVNGQCARGRMIADRAVRSNPYNPEISGLMGFLLFQCDDPLAASLLHAAVTLDPDVPTFYSAAYILVLLEQGRTADATHVAETIRPPGIGMSGQYEIAQVIASSAKGDVAGARAHWQRAAKISRASPADADRVLSRYFFSPDFRAKVIRYLTDTRVLAPKS